MCHAANLDSMSDKCKTFFSLCRKSTKPELRDEQYQTLCKVHVLGHNKDYCAFTCSYLLWDYGATDPDNFLKFDVSIPIQEYDGVLRDSSEKVKLANQVCDLVRTLSRLCFLCN